MTTGLPSLRPCAIPALSLSSHVLLFKRARFTIQHTCATDNPQDPRSRPNGSIKRSIRSDSMHASHPSLQTEMVAGRPTVHPVITSHLAGAFPRPEGVTCARAPPLEPDSPERTSTHPSSWSTTKPFSIAKRSAFASNPAVGRRAFSPNPSPRPAAHPPRDRYVIQRDHLLSLSR
jgi:hypothetical protein